MLEMDIIDAWPLIREAAVYGRARMDKLKRFLKENIYVILGFACVAIIGSLYLSNAWRPSGYVTAGDGQNSIPIFNASQDSDRTSAQSAPIKVYIVGEVVNPGVYELSAGSRVEDALAMAGGPTEEANLVPVNLAAYVSDAQRIFIPTEGVPFDESELLGYGADSSGGGQGSLININTADSTTLQRLPGIGPTLAGNIIAYRDKNGAFRTVEEIMNVNRIGEATFENLRDLITVG